MGQNADGILLGTEATLTGGAVLSTTRDAAGAYYNPAGLAALPAATLQVSGSAYRLSYFQLHNFVHVTLPWTRIDQTQKILDWSAVPSVAAYGFRISSRVGAAFGVWLPASESLSLVSTVRSSGALETGGATYQVDFTQRIALTQRTERTYFGAAAGFELRPGLRVGAAAFLVYQRLEQFLEIFEGALTSSSETGATASASVRGTQTQLAGRMGLGLQWQVAPSSSIAVALKTSALPLAARGDVTTVTQSASLVPGMTPAVEFRVAPTKMSGITEPWRLAAGGAFAGGRSTLRAEVDWQAPQGARRGVLNGRVGLLQQTSPDLSWGLGLFTDRSRENVASGGLTVDYYGMSGGLDYRPPLVRAARSPGATWDVRASLAMRYAFGTGEVERAVANVFGSPGGPPPESTAAVVSHSLSVYLGATMQF